MPGTPRTQGLNLLVVMADQLGARMLGCAGHPVIRTPHIDSLAARGALFEAAYCNSPLCAPARFTMMAGRHASRIAAYDNAAEFHCELPTFAHFLRAMGYYTCLSGKMHFVGADQLHGFEDRLTTDVYPADFAWSPDWERPLERIEEWYHNMLSVVQAGVEAATNQYDYDDEVAFLAERRIYELARQPENTPFCLLVSFIHPHDPYATRRRYWDRYDHDAIDLPRVGPIAYEAMDPHSRRIFDGIAADEYDITEEQVRRARHAYYGNVSYVDDQVGRLLAALEETGLAERTVVVFTADHGDMLGERGLWYKMSFFEGSARVPLIMAGPGIRAGARLPHAVSHIDLLPTLTALARASGAGPVPEAPEPLDGRSLLPLLEGDGAADPDEAIGEYMGECALGPLFMIRRGRYKYVHCAADPDQLYDLAADPDERINLAADPAQAERMAAFRAEAAARWDSAAITRAVIASQRRRRLVHRAMTQGKRTAWDWQPRRDAAEEFMRSHHMVHETDLRFRFPPVPVPQARRPRKG